MEFHLSGIGQALLVGCFPLYFSGNEDIVLVMKRMTTALLLSSILLAAGLPAREAKKRPLEIFAFFNLNFGSLDTAYPNRHTLESSPGFEGSYASQALAIQGKAREGFSTGLSLFLSDDLGLKLGLNYARNLLSGENSPYQVHLQYVSRQPPDYTPHQVINDQSIEWVPTRGSVKNLFLALNLQYVLFDYRRFSASLSAGGGISRVWGDFSPLGYSEYWLGGHGVLFSQQYLVRLAIPSSYRASLNADCELGLRISERITFAAKFAYFFCGSVSFSPAIDNVLYYYSLDKVDENTLSRIKSRMTLNALKIKPSFLALNLGIKYHFFL